MFKPKRINITLNARQIGDAQILAALETLEGESASVIKALALRGIMTDPSMYATLAHGIDLMRSSRNAEGCGFKPPKVTKTVLTHHVSKKMGMSPSAIASVADGKSMPDVLKQPAPVTIQPILVPSPQTSVKNVTKTSIVARRGDPMTLTDFLYTQ